MILNKRQFHIGGLVILLSGIIASCQPTPTLATSSAPGMSVGITQDNCPNMIVQVGQQVTWTNQDTQEHFVRDNSTKGSSLFDSGILQPGDSFAFTFLQPGKYTYECSEDGAIDSTITVEEP